ncbi:MAG TPA: methyltransferase domain-containing protein [Burkholderiales bacterium]|nr:methyltransferase domain-containing protein [Burkholderiales bacterium]
MRPRYLLPALLAICLGLAPVFTALGAQEQNVSPGINRQYENPDWSHWVAAFESEDREVYARRHAIVAATGVRPGMVVADIGAGTGLFTRLFASGVAPAGKVYAVDISATFIDNILRTCRELGLDNVEGIVNTARSAGLPDASIDLAFITDTYHHFEYPATMLASIHSALRAGGRLILIDFRRDPRHNPRWIMQHVRAGKDTVIREVQAAGFRFLEEIPLLRSNYFLVFEKIVH